jgi:hypothetical protein
VKTVRNVLVILVATAACAHAGEREVASLRDFRSAELKSVGLRISRALDLHVRGLGAGEGDEWMATEGGMFASGWIIDARTRAPVWEMGVGNTVKEGDDRSCDEFVRLPAGDYEVYFSAPVFSVKSWRRHLVMNIDHRKSPLFKDQHDEEGLWFLKGWWSADIPELWEKRAKQWGLDLYVSDPDRASVQTFPVPREQPNVVFKADRLGDHVRVQQGISVTSPVVLNVYALGEKREDAELVDYGWIVDAETRDPVWEMTPKNTREAGGAGKNVSYSGTLRLTKGEYVVYFITDDSHSNDDWNSFPPADPFRWGLTISAPDERQKESVSLFKYQEIENRIVSITRVGNDEHRQESFTLKEPAKLRVLAFGEKSLSWRSLVDYGYILDAGTREKVWTMDVDRCRHAGGASKNVLIDEVVTLPKGSYVVVYTTDDSHSYDNWNSDPPYEPENYGIIVMGAGKNFRPGIVEKGVEAARENIIAQIIRVGDSADRSIGFSLDRPTRVRVYAIGEGQKRTMYDYGWIESREKGTVVWEMTYGTTFHAGGARKNRMVNTTILLDRGDYALRYVTDDSHSYNNWNETAPDDQQYWGITLFEDASTKEALPPLPPIVPVPPETP